MNRAEYEVSKRPKGALLWSVAVSFATKTEAVEFEKTIDRAKYGVCNTFTKG